MDDLHELQIAIDALASASLPVLTGASASQIQYGIDSRQQLIDELVAHGRKVHAATLASVETGYEITGTGVSQQAAAMRRRCRYIESKTTATWWINHKRFGTV